MDEKGELYEAENSSRMRAESIREACPILYIVIPCYNEEKALPVMLPAFLNRLSSLTDRDMNPISRESRLLFVNDGSKDASWDIICRAAREDERVKGICLSRNRGHQNALLAGLMEARPYCDITISIDLDGQDDLDAMDAMTDAWFSGSDIVYGVRNDRSEDHFFKRATAETFYKFMSAMGVEIVFNHADYRLVSARVLDELSKFKEVNIFLRGMLPLVGFRSSIVTYKRHARVAGESHYPLGKMAALAVDGITSLSIQPIRVITLLGLGISLASLGVLIWAVLTKAFGHAISGWASIICILCFLSGIQLFCIGVIGEYIGKIYLETKARPRYIIADRTEEKGTGPAYHSSCQ